MIATSNALDRLHDRIPRKANHVPRTPYEDPPTPPNSPPDGPPDCWRYPPSFPSLTTTGPTVRWPDFAATSDKVDDTAQVSGHLTHQACGWFQRSLICRLTADLTADFKNRTPQIRLELARDHRDFRCGESIFPVAKSLTSLNGQEIGKPRPRHSLGDTDSSHGTNAVKVTASVRTLGDGYTPPPLCGRKQSHGDKISDDAFPISSPRSVDQVTSTA